MLKDIPESILSHFNERLWPRLCKDTSALLRLPFDTIPDQRIFVYKYLTDEFLCLVREQIPMQARRHILKVSLQAIAELHDRDIVHLGHTIHPPSGLEADLLQTSSLTISWSTASTKVMIQSLNR